MSSGHESKVWYSYMGGYDGKYPPYYDLDGIAWYDKLKNDLPQVQDTLLSFLKESGVKIEKFFNTDPVEGEGWWGGFTFMYWGLRDEQMMNKGADLFAYFKDIPGMITLSVSILQPNTRINGHYGDTDAIYRIHIPVYIPAQLPACGLTVAGITKPWVENDMIVFCDAHYHEAWNMTDNRRIIMILDVVRDEFLPETEKICATVLASMQYQRLILRYKFIGVIGRWVPKWIKNIGRKVLKFSLDKTAK